MSSWRSCLAASGALLVLAACGSGSTEARCATAADCPAGYACRDGACLPSFANGDADGGDANLGDPDPGDPAAGDPDPGDPGPGDFDLTVPDTTGPKIEILTPPPASLVGTIVNISAKVTDISGVKAGSVKARLTESGSFEVSLVAVGNDTYAADFNTLQLPPMEFVVLRVTAEDELGLQSAAGLVFAVDNVGPILSLVSPWMQLSRTTSDGTTECSQPFYPLADAVLPGQTIGPSSLLFWPRARIEDRGNGSIVGFGSVIAGVDYSTTKLYMLSSIGINKGNKLVVGAGQGSRCSHIAPEAVPDPIVPEPGQALVLDLVPIEPAGSGDYTPGDFTALPCKTPGNETKPPKDICDPGALVGITTWISYSFNKMPAIYGVSIHTPGAPFTCGGAPVDANNFVADGPVCLAAVAADALGNTSVSAPVAICLDRDGVGDDCLTFDADAVAAACSDGCIADEFDVGVEVQDVR